MKKLLKIGNLLLIAGVCFFSFSCGDKEDISDRELLIGTWQIESIEADLKINGQDFIKYLTETFVLSKEEAQTISDSFNPSLDSENYGMITFAEDGSFIEHGGEEESKGKWSLTGKTLTIDSISVEVKKLTKAELEIFASESKDVDIDDNGTVEKFIVGLTINLKK